MCDCSVASEVILVNTCNINLYENTSKGDKNLWIDCLCLNDDIQLFRINNANANANEERAYLTSKGELGSAGINIIVPFGFAFFRRHATGNLVFVTT